ncbi:MAG: thermonuclease family protein [Abitibacteriaceae bacterium]|nr:thermonuclease family protein [Abditibacteriaceae bacterium]
MGNIFYPPAPGLNADNWLRNSGRMRQPALHTGSFYKNGGRTVLHTPGYLPPGRKERMEREMAQQQADWSDETTTSPWLAIPPHRSPQPGAYPMPSASAEQAARYNQLPEVPVAASADSSDVHRDQLRRAKGAGETQQQLSLQAASEETPWHGSLVSVTGPAVITVKVDEQTFSVKLYGLDAVDQDTSSTQKARQFIEELVRGGELTVYPKATSPDGIISGWVFKGPICINREVIASGYAAWNQQEAPGEEKLKTLQVTAQATKRGLWGSH